MMGLCIFDKDIFFISIVSKTHVTFQHNEVAVTFLSIICV